MALGLPLPEKVFGHPWFNAAEEKKSGDGQEVKMSKSRGNVIYADELAEIFSIDGVRYYALSEMPYDQDGRISYYNVLSRYNSDLANNLGNLVNRTHAMAVKYFGGVVPQPTGDVAPDDELKAAVKQAVEKSRQCFDTFRIADGLGEIFSMLRRANKYIDETMPWALAKDEAQKGRLATVIYNLLEVIRVAAVLLTPMLPTTAEKIFARLATDKTAYETVSCFGALEADKSLGEVGAPLFARVDEKVIDEIVARKAEEAAAAARAAAPIPEPEHEAQIKVDAFAAVELRAAKIIACEPVPKAKKLLKLQVDLGYERRQIVSGIAKFYSPADLIGKKVIIVANLAPATLCGVESQGMLLASGEEEIRVVFLDDSVTLGDRIH
jgi:methionyl-tRNA synthetase